MADAAARGPGVHLGTVLLRSAPHLEREAAVENARSSRTALARRQGRHPIRSAAAASTSAARRSSLTSIPNYIGYQDFALATGATRRIPIKASGPENYTRDNIVEHRAGRPGRPRCGPQHGRLRRHWLRVMTTAPKTIPNAARYCWAAVVCHARFVEGRSGRLRSAWTHREGRPRTRSAHRVRLVKLWVVGPAAGDSAKTPMLDAYKAVIEEAHKNAAGGRPHRGSP